MPAAPPRRYGPEVADLRWRFEAELWRWSARPDLWVFASVPDDASAEIRAVPRPRSGFGAVRVAVAVGGSRWSTSVFPESAEGAYVLPVKRSVREAEGLGVGDVARIELALVL